MYKLLLPSLFLLTACSHSDMTNFSLNCQGVLTDYSPNKSSSVREGRQYEFDEKTLKEKNCAFNDKTIICIREYVSGPKLVTRERFIYNTSDYTLSELKQVIGYDETKNLPMYVSTLIYQSNCPMTVKRAR